MIETLSIYIELIFIVNVHVINVHKVTVFVCDFSCREQ